MKTTDAIPLHFPSFPDHLILEACIYHNRMVRGRAENRMKPVSREKLVDPFTSSKKYLKRITVNYIRHQILPYDDALNKAGGDFPAPKEVVVSVRLKVYRLILRTYPWLCRECWRQAKRRDLSGLDATKRNKNWR